jgi:hypothetical protein
MGWKGRFWGRSPVEPAPNANSEVRMRPPAFATISFRSASHETDRHDFRTEARATQAVQLVPTLLPSWGFTRRSRMSRSKLFW